MEYGNNFIYIRNGLVLCVFENRIVRKGCINTNNICFFKPATVAVRVSAVWAYGRSDVAVNLCGVSLKIKG